MTVPGLDPGAVRLPGIDPSSARAWLDRVLSDAALLIYQKGLSPMEALAVCVRSTEEGDTAGSAAMLINAVSGRSVAPGSVYTYLHAASRKGVSPWIYPPLKGEGNRNVSTANSEGRAPLYIPPGDAVYDALNDATAVLDDELQYCDGRTGTAHAPLEDDVERSCAVFAICYGYPEECDVQVCAFMNAWLGFLPGDPQLTPARYRTALRHAKERGVDVADGRWRGLVTGEPPELDILR